RQRGEQLAEPVRERLARADQVVDRAAGDVDRVGDELAGQGQAHGLRDRDAGLLLRLGGGGTQVRGEGDVVELEELRGRPALGGRLGGVHVQRGGRDPAGGERLVQRLLVDQPAAGGVDHVEEGLASANCSAPISPVVWGVLGMWTVRTPASRISSSSSTTRAPSSAARAWWT